GRRSRRPPARGTRPRARAGARSGRARSGSSGASRAAHSGVASEDVAPSVVTEVCVVTGPVSAGALASPPTGLTGVLQIAVVAFERSIGQQRSDVGGVSWFAAVQIRS